MLAPLERPDVGGDRPPIPHPHPRGIARDRTEAVRHHLEEVAGRSLAQAIDVERWWARVAPSHDHAVARPDAIVARRAEDVVALLAAVEHLPRHGEGRRVARRGSVV